MSNSKFRNPNLAGAGQNENDSRRSFLKKTTAATITLANTNLFSFAADSLNVKLEPQKEIPCTGV